MKIVISHDVDNLGAVEHLLRDRIIPRSIYRSFLETKKRKISVRLFLKRLKGSFKKNFWTNLEELIRFDKEQGVRSTFFVAVARGYGISYSKKQAKTAINLIRNYGFEIGCHGVFFNDFEKMKREYKEFKEISGLENFGVRIHRLNLAADTLEKLEKIGYLYDTTVLSSELKQKYKIGRLTEIPFHIMDVRLLGFRQNFTLEQAKEKTVSLFKKAERENKDYIGILFHDRRFSDYFPDFKNWYKWLVSYCKDKGYEFANYKDLL